MLSNKNIVGMSFASAIVVLALLGLLKAYWLPIAVISYIVGFIVGPKEKEIKFFHMKGESLEDYPGFLNNLQNKIMQSSKLPEDAKKIILAINTNALEMISFIQQKDNDLDEYSEDISNLKMVFDSYLPKLINQYEKLPTKYATEVKTSSGKTAKEMLLEQLKLLEKTTVEIAYGMYENDVSKLKVNGRFLKEKFERKNLFEINEEKELEK